MLNQLVANPGFKKFLVRLVVFLVDFDGPVVQHGGFYFQQKSGPDYETIYAMEKSREDLMVFGSSRARNHYHPKAFEEALGMSFYNAGRNGNFILYSNAVAQSVLKRHQPKIVILDIVGHEFEYYAPSYETFIQNCKKAGVQLYVICSPYFNTFPVRDKSIVLAEEIARKYEVPFWDHSQDPTFSGNPKNFYDIRHLNEPASLRFSYKLAEKIKSADGKLATRP